MKRKFLIFTLCFTVIFSSINYKKSYADAGIISFPMLATVGSLAVASGIVLKGNDDLYDIGRLFYEYVKEKNDLTWDIVNSTFNASVGVLSNGLVSVDSNFLDIVKGFFDTKFISQDSVGYYNGLPFFGVTNEKYSYYNIPYVDYVEIGEGYASPHDFTYYGLDFVYQSKAGAQLKYYIYKDDLKIGSANLSYYCTSGSTTHKSEYSKIFTNGKNIYSIPYCSHHDTYVYSAYTSFSSNFSNISIPYEGGYTWDNVENKKENESIALPIPGNLGQLVGQGSTDFWDNTDNLVGTGGISIPSVDNPSISVDNTDSFPKVEDVPDIDVPGTDIIVPSFPSFGDSLDFSPMYLTNVTEKFPFSLPWDIGRLIQKFDVDPVPPIFEVPMVSETITLDLTEFDELAAIVRFFVLICFILALIFISTKLLG